jgi:hypothetical protein
MSDRRRVLNTADIRRFLVAKAPNGACSACECREFDILDEALIGGRVGVPVLTPHGDETVSVGVLEILVLACTNCGNVRTYDRRVVAEWISAHPAKMVAAAASSRPRP